MRRLRIVPVVALAAATIALGAIPGSRATATGTPPTGHRAGAAATGLNKVQHIVVLFPENHSFDNYFGRYPVAANPPGEPKFVADPDTPHVNGLTKKLLTDNPNSANPFRIDRKDAHTCGSKHAYTAEQSAAHGGALDRFVEELGPPNAECVKKIPMAYYDGNTVTALWNYAQRFALSDNTFGTTYGPSTIGALNLIAGQTHGATPDDMGVLVHNGTVIGDAEPGFDDCAKAEHHVTLSGQNVGDLLNAANVTWGWFEGGFKRTGFKDDLVTALCETKHINSAGKPDKDYTPHHEPFQYYASTSNMHHDPPSSVTAIGTTDVANHQYDLSSFWLAADAHNVPSVSFLKPPAYQDGHPGSSDPIAEQRWLVTTLNRLQQLPEWSAMLVVLAWDDSGGWYDHVFHAPVNGSNDVADTLDGPGVCGPAPGPGDYVDRCGYGPRIPLLVLSPWSKRNYVDHTLNDQTSILRLIEQRFSLGTIGDQSFDANPSGGTLLGMLDFAHPHPTPLLLVPGTGLKQ